MGYSANFRLEVVPFDKGAGEPDESLVHEIVRRVRALGSGADALDVDGSTYFDLIRWDDSDQHVRQISADPLCRDLVLHLYVAGEDGERWVVYAYRGQTEIGWGETVYEPMTIGVQR